MSARTTARTLVRALIVGSAVLGAGAGVALADGPPAVSGADTDLWNTGPVYTVTFDGGYLVWSASNGDGGVTSQSPATIVSAQPFAEGAQWFRFVSSGGVTIRAFTEDLTPPGALTVTGPATAPAGSAVAFSWTGGEPGARFTWRLDGPSAQAPVTTTVPAAQTGPLAPGSYTLTVTQTDLAGNAGPPQTAGLTIAPPAPSPIAPPAAITRPRPVIVKLPAEHPDRLVPRAAAMVATQRPVLRWKKGPRGTTLYNVQVFRVTGMDSERASSVRLRKVSSAFPHGRKMRTRPLAKGACYVWRVWPFKAHRFTKSPLGVSHFCVMRRR